MQQYVKITVRRSSLCVYENDHNLMDIGTPQHPVVLAHGLLGFDELRLAGKWLPGVHYWRGITEALKANGIEVITAHVPASGSIEIRSEQLSENIYRKAGGKSVNIIAFVSPDRILVNVSQSLMSCRHSMVLALKYFSSFH